MSLHFIQALKLNTTTLDGMQEQEIDPGIEEFLASGDSRAFNTLATINRQWPKVPFTTLKIANAMTLFGIDGYEISANPLECYTVEADHAATRKTTGEKINVTAGIVVPTQLSVKNEPGATLAYTAFGGAEDGTIPFAATSAQTVPIGLDIDELFRAGDVTINSVSVGPVSGYTIDFGIEVEVQIDPTTAFPTLVYIKKHAPKITILSQKATSLVQMGVSGNDDLVSLSLLKCESAGTIAATGHKTFATHKNFVRVGKLGGSHNEPAETEIVVDCLYDGTNAPITVT